MVFRVHVPIWRRLRALRGSYTGTLWAQRYFQNVHEPLTLRANPLHPNPKHLPQRFVRIRGLRGEAGVHLLLPDT